jgi:acetyltransferase-like isoleucine patch superfamily enzyme
MALQARAEADTGHVQVEVLTSLESNLRWAEEVDTSGITKLSYHLEARRQVGMDAEEARTMLWKVVDPSLDTTHKFDAPPREKGMLSHGVRIEAPFTCTYGYNLKVMDDVYIGKATTIDDAGKVEIGARTWIGPCGVPK